MSLFFSGTLWALNRFILRQYARRKPPGDRRAQPLAAGDAHLGDRRAGRASPRSPSATRWRPTPRATSTGKNENPLADLLGKADIGWTVSRGPFAVNGASNGLNISTTLNGSLRVTGQIANQGGNLTGALGGLLGDKLGGEVQKLATRALDQRADIRGNVTVNSRPALLPTWRIEPNLSGNVALADGGVTVAGIKLNVSNEVKPLLDKTVSEQIGSLSNKLRNDPLAGKRGAQAVGPDVPLDLARRRPRPARRTCGSRSSRPAPSPRSRKSSPTG